MPLRATGLKSDVAVPPHIPAGICADVSRMSVVAFADGFTAGETYRQPAYYTSRGVILCIAYGKPYAVIANAVKQSGRLVFTGLLCAYQ
jgi:hypothetical protein